MPVPGDDRAKGPHRAGPARTWGWSPGSRRPRLLHLATLTAAVLPLAVATVVELVRGWEPTSDDANIAFRSWLVLSSHSPQLGQFSQVSGTRQHSIYDLGPLLYWMLTVPVHLDPRQGMLWGSALFAGLGLVVAVEAGWTAAGARGGAAVAAVVLTLVVVYPPVVLDPGWNPHLGTVWMLATVGLAWAVGAGHLRALPVLVGAASVACQCHLIFVPPVVLCCAGAVALAVVGSLRGGRGGSGGGTGDRTGEGSGEGLGEGPGEGLGEGPGEGRGTRTWVWPVVAGVVVGVACWTVPLVQQLTGHPGNVTLLLQRAGHGGTLGWGRGWQAVGGAIVPWPTWVVQPDGSSFFSVVSSLQARGSVVSLLAVVGLVPVVLVALLRRDRTVATAGVIVLCAAVGVAWAVAAIPTANYLTMLYLYPVVWPVGIAAVLLYGWLAVVVVRWAVLGLATRRGRRPGGADVPGPDRSGDRGGVSTHRWTGVATGVVTGVVAVATVVATAGAAHAAIATSPTLGGWGTVRTVGDVAGFVEAAVPKGPVHLTTGGTGTIEEYELIYGLDWRLFADGWDPTLDAAPAAYVGPPVVPTGKAAPTTVIVTYRGGQVEVDITGRTAGTGSGPVHRTFNRLTG